MYVNVHVFIIEKKSMDNPFSSSWRDLPIWKIVLFGLLALLGLAIVLGIVKTLLSELTSVNTGAGGSVSVMRDSDSASYSKSPNYESSDGLFAEAPSATPSPSPDSESYEALSYQTLFKVGDLDTLCNTLETWKPLPYVVFESAVRNELRCTYRFKVERAHVAGIVTEIENLDPDEFSARTETMKKQVVEYEGQLAILLRKQELLETTLTDAVIAYDELRDLATSVEDVESLTKIIDSKLNAIERLTRERVTLSQQIDAIARRSAELADTIEYVYFFVDAQKYQVVDIASIKNSWVREMRMGVTNVNDTLQELTLGVLVLLLNLLRITIQVGIVLVVVVVVGKFAWQNTRRFWNSDTPQV